jgi:hypothetical protein
VIKKLRDKIVGDFKESKIDWQVALSFIPIAFFTYLFHEFGHWSAGEFLGNDMTLSLNNSAPKSGYFINDSHELWSAIGGPAFTVLQAIIFFIFLRKTKSVYAYSIVFFAVFSRFFSIIFGGLSLQDEARIAAMLEINQYLPALFVLTILSIILWQSNRIMNFRIKTVGYFTVLSTMAILLVIGINELFYL